jgi:hypothetical protein
MRACLVDTIGGTFVGVTRELAGAGLRGLLLAHDAEALGLAVELVDVDGREAPVVVSALHGRHGRCRRAVMSVASKPPRA